MTGPGRPPRRAVLALVEADLVPSVDRSGGRAGRARPPCGPGVSSRRPSGKTGDVITVSRVAPRRALAVFSVLCALGLQAAAQADARSGCASQPVSQPFVPWLDYGQYESVPGGSFETGAAGWTLAGGAAVVAGNESYHVRAPADALSLALPAGASAGSPDVCVAVEHPTIRFFVRNTGSSTAQLGISVVVSGPDGQRRTVPVGAVTGTPDWRPTPIVVIGVNVLSGLGTQQVGLHFAANGAGGKWNIDDVYLDPYGKG